MLARMLIVVCVAILIAAMAQSGLILVTSLLQQQAVTALAHGVDRRSVHDELKFVYELDARSGESLRLLAETAADGAAAIDFHDKLTAIEPNVARYWLLAAKQKAAEAEFDDAFKHQMQSAVRLGAYEPRIQFEVISLGADHWLSLDLEVKELVIETGRRAILTQAPFGRREILARLEQSGLMPIVCRRVGKVDCPPVG